MRSIVRALTLIAALAMIIPPAPCSGQAGGSAPARAKLEKPYTPSVGDMVALTTGQMLGGLRKDAKIPMLTVYDGANKKVAVIAYGQQSSLDQAKAVIEGLRMAMAPIIPVIGPLYQVELKETDFQFYFHAQSGQIMHWADGKYTVEQAEEEVGGN